MTKPFYITNPTTGELENTNDPNWFSNKKKFLSAKTNKYADKIVDNNYAKNKHKTPFTHVAENAVKELGFKYNSTTGTFRNNDGKTLPMKEALEATEALDKNFKNQKTDDYVKLAKLPIIERNIKNGVHYSGSREHLYDNPTVKKYRDFKENKKREIEDKKWREDFDKEYSEAAINKNILRKERENLKNKLPPAHGFSNSDIVIRSYIQDAAEKRLKYMDKTPTTSIGPSIDSLQLIRKTAEEITPTKSFEDHYREVVDRENNTTGLASLLGIHGK
tara:strand:+ start:160 stop:987 length:828 start_codon:yes stop_codon:yes gene_type:complete